MGPAGAAAAAAAWCRADAAAGPKVQELKWTAEDFAAAGEGQLPLGKHTDEWVVGDVEAGFKEADLVLDETFVGNNTSHQPMETRTAMAYWQNGKLYMHCSTQSVMRTVGSVARWVGIKPEDVVIISEYTGGGFGSKGSGSVFVAVAALLSKKANAPVMMRISRDDEQNIGRARPALHSRVKVGFRKDGRITAIDGLAVVDNGPYDVVSDSRSAGDHISLSYQPLAMRWRTLTVLTNTPSRGAQRAPGGMQGNSLMAPMIAKAARKLGIDEVAIHRINAPEGQAAVRGAKRAGRAELRHQRVPEGGARQGRGPVQLGREEGAQRQARGLQGARASASAVSAYSAGSLGFDGLIDHQAGRPPDDPVRHRQPRHRIGVRRPPRRRGTARHAVGEGATWSGATRRSTCRRRAARAAARRRMP